MTNVNRNSDADHTRHALHAARRSALGIAYEAACAPFAKVSAPSVDEKRADFLRAQEAYLAAGVTSVHDAGLLDLGLAQELHAQRLVRLRVYVLALDGLGDTTGTRLVRSGIRTGFGDE